MPSGSMMSDEAEGKEEPLLGELHLRQQTDKDDEAWSPQSMFYRCFITVAALCFVGTTVTLAVEYPVSKHAFTRVNCVSQTELLRIGASLVDFALPLGFPLVCKAGGAELDCATARESAYDAVDAHCNDTESAESVCVGLRAFAELGVSPMEIVLATPDVVDDLALDVAFTVWCGANATRSSLAVCSGPSAVSVAAAACGEAAACSAAKDFWEAPQQFCASTTDQHGAVCKATGHFVEELEVAALEACAKQGFALNKACHVLNVSLHDRGHWTAYCTSNLFRRAECEAVRAAVNLEVDAKVCSKSDEYKQYCAYGRAVAARYGNASAPMPFLEVLQDATKLFCASGFCSDRPGYATGLQRLEQGFASAVLRKLDVPYLCGAWPKTAAKCADVKAQLKAKCAASPQAGLACAWGRQLNLVRLNATLNATAVHALFDETFSAVSAACAAAEPAPFAAAADALHALGGPAAPDAATVRTYACDAVGLAGAAGRQCPDMLPFLAEAAIPTPSS
ncbi:hypothetical protein M885DRAFT_468775 [Pelagophyceae sp. CCMP2097]|nr:hypothetical protein M885DRAFT_468775 [Pelagophyceae sp. CCMP2097]